MRLSMFDNDDSLSAKYQANSNTSLHSLKKYQTEFYNMIVHDDRASIAEYIGSTADWQLDVYQNNYHQCLFSILTKTFKRTRLYLENNNYDVNYLFNSYIKVNASIEKNLALYGAGFASWLRSFKDGVNIIRIAADLAMLDYYLYQCYYASNSQPFEIKLFLALNEAEKLNAKFQCIPSIQLLESQWDLINTQSSASTEYIKLKVQKNNMFFYIIYRELGIAKYEQIPKDMYLLLSGLKKPRTLLYISGNSSYNTEVNMPALIQKQWVSMQ
jgi:hypothetical protein